MIMILVKTDKENGTYVKFVPDADVFKAYHLEINTWINFFGIIVI